MLTRFPCILSQRTKLRVGSAVEKNFASYKILTKKRCKIKSILSQEKNYSNYYGSQWSVLQIGNLGRNYSGRITKIQHGIATTRTNACNLLFLWNCKIFPLPRFLLSLILLTKHHYSFPLLKKKKNKSYIWKLKSYRVVSLPPL